MDISQLNMFCTVAECGSISQAAARLHRVPSNLSTRIKQLEQELDCELFIREKLRLRLSADGHLFWQYASQILAKLEEAKSVLSGGEPRGRFALGALESTAAVRIPPLLARYHQLYDQVALEFTTGPSDDLTAALLAGKLDAIFIDGPIDTDVLTGMAVWQEEMVLVAAGDHPPVRRARDVAGAPLYAFRRTCAYRRRFEQWFQDDGATPGRIYEMESYHGMLACVSAGAGLALAPRSLLDHLPGAKTISIWPISPTLRNVPTWLVWRKEARSVNLTALRQLLVGQQ
ncbi:LysR family transcriptional regulator [Pantoea sp. 1.19]|uniref:putrescine utilization regulator PtrR n=1 Tax=Pantoea sp. 1.19 TaxID=1925589 RepID=UPI000948BDE8|nr:LysR family transcriptional regulator [Pantoea sp. 1.19]